MIKFPSIEQFRNVVRNVAHKARFIGVDETGAPQYNAHAKLPKLKFRGTVKLHGTNAGIVYDRADKTFSYQSRERELSLTSDNAGFMLAMSGKEAVLRDIVESIEDACITFLQLGGANMPTKLVIFGEWCGGNIQAGVALSGLPKMFVIFGVKAIFGEDHATWLNLDILNVVQPLARPDANIYCILDYPTYSVEIDFEKPEEIQNELVRITTDVEAECPVGKAFKSIGIGEGVVWACVEDGFYGSDYWFKVKGEKHSNSKVKKLPTVDVEAVKAVNEFVELAVTEGRLMQGLQNLVREQLKPFDMTSMGDFIRWVYQDVIKEETDVIVANQLDTKKLGGPISNKARKWYAEKFNDGFVVPN